MYWDCEKFQINEISGKEKKKETKKQKSLTPRIQPISSNNPKVECSRLILGNEISSLNDPLFFFSGKNKGGGGH